MIGKKVTDTTDQLLPADQAVMQKFMFLLKYIQYNIQALPVLLNLGVKTNRVILKDFWSSWI